MANRVKTFFVEVKQELGKVVWPDRNEVVGSTFIVVGTTLMLAAFIGVVDFILSNLMRLILG